MSDFPIEWIAFLIAITTSTFRALNLGYQAESYLISIVAYTIFIFYSEKKTQKVLNIFYIITALFGAYRYGFHSLYDVFSFCNFVSLACPVCPV